MSTFREDMQAFTDIVSCTSLPGAPLGAYTCSAGKCRASMCKKGFELDKEGICVLKAEVGVAGRRI